MIWQRGSGEMFRFHLNLSHCLGSRAGVIGGFLGLGTIKIFFAMSKTPRMQIMSSFGSGRAQFLIFLCRGSGGVTRSANIFRVDIKTLKMIF